MGGGEKNRGGWGEEKGRLGCRGRVKKWGDGGVFIYLICTDKKFLLCVYVCLCVFDNFLKTQD